MHIVASPGSHGALEGGGLSVRSFGRNLSPEPREAWQCAKARGVASRPVGERSVIYSHSTVDTATPTPGAEVRWVWRVSLLASCLMQPMRVRPRTGPRFCGIVRCMRNSSAHHALSWRRLARFMLVLPALLAARPAGTLRTARVQMVDYTGRTESEWREALTPQEFDVMREAGTEPPWSSPLNELKEPGVLVCTACETPLFRTSEKFESGSGWPSA